MRAVSICCALLSVADAVAQRRPRPSATAAKVGLHLPWQDSLESALAAARAQERRVFWYVSRVPKTPMDRLLAIDMYMRAGFFSDPDIGELLQEFVLFRGAPKRADAKRYDLRPFRFVEPGFLVLDAKGKELARAHSITTFSPAWLEHRLRPFLPATAASFGAAASPAIRATLQALGKGDLAGARAALGETEVKSVRGRFLDAAITFLLGKHTAATTAWQKLAQAHPQHALGRRAAAEAERFGPISRGFWIWRDLPGGWQADALGTTCPRTAKDLSMLRRRSVDFLLGMQNEDGGFLDSNYDFGGQDSLPNVYVAVTALCVRALLRHRVTNPKRCDAAIARGLAYCLDPKHVAANDKDEWIWARVYPIHLVCDVLDTKVDLAGHDAGGLRKALSALCAEALGRQQSDGAFRHEYANPFATAAVLMALHAARRHGVRLPAKDIKRAVVSLKRCRTGRGAFSYFQAGRRRPASASVKGAAGRMPYCEAALFVWDASNEKAVISAVAAAFEHHEQLASTRKYDDHANGLGYGGFFFWFDMLGREMAFDLLGSKAAQWRGKQRDIVLSVPEIDGCFVDSHELGRSYGTAVALLILPSQQ